MYEHLARDLREQSCYLPRDYTYRLVCEAADAIDQLEALCKRQEAKLVELTEELASKPRWIPVTERLPELMHEYVLCCGAKGGQFVGWVATKTYDGGDKATAFVHGGHGRNITHWMPLPKPPKEET
jgi:hypothetical protein